jgi:N-acetyltransferase 10
MRKKVDSRIRTLVENCVKLRQRGLFVLIGDKGRDQVVNLHYMLSKASVKARPSVLWCYKKDLALSRCVRACARARVRICVCVCA